MDQVEFTQLEKILMERAGDSDAGHKGILPYLITGAVLSALLVYSFLSKISSPVIFWPALCYIILTTAQRVSAHWAIGAHKVLVMKLVRHAADSGRKIQAESPTG